MKVCKFCILLYYAGKSVITFPHSRNSLHSKIKRRKFRRTDFEIWLLAEIALLIHLGNDKLYKDILNINVSCSDS